MAAFGPFAVAEQVGCGPGEQHRGELFAFGGGHGLQVGVGEHQIRRHRASHQENTPKVASPAATPVAAQEVQLPDRGGQSDVGVAVGVEDGCGELTANADRHVVLPGPRADRG